MIFFIVNWTPAVNRQPGCRREGLVKLGGKNLVFSENGDFLSTSIDQKTVNLITAGELCKQAARNGRDFIQFFRKNYNFLKF